MPYYAVGFGTWHHQSPGCFMDGSYAKTAGPFRKAKQAWEAANKLQAGASMMANFPYIFKAGKGINLTQLANMIDREPVIQKEYSGERSVHVLRFTRDWEEEIENQWRHECPSSLPARRRFRNMILKAQASGQRVPRTPFAKIPAHAPSRRIRVRAEDRRCGSGQIYLIDQTNI
jgi:hypothetical protein